MTSWLCLDLETADAPAVAIDAAIAAWKPPGNCRAEETIERKRQDAASRIRERAALLDASPIICLALTTNEGTSILFHSFGQQQHVAGWMECALPDERIMLMVLREYLDAQAPDLTVVGHNIRGFDLPKLRQAYIRHRLKLPEILRPRMDDEPPLRVADTMHLVKSFSMELRDERFISLDQVAAVLGIDRPKQFVSGADVPRLYREGRYQEIATYSAIDTTTTARAYLLMTGQAPELE